MLYIKIQKLTWKSRFVHDEGSMDEPAAQHKQHIDPANVQYEVSLFPNINEKY